MAPRDNLSFVMAGRESRTASASSDDNLDLIGIGNEQVARSSSTVAVVNFGSTVVQPPIQGDLLVGFADFPSEAEDGRDDEFASTNRPQSPVEASCSIPASDPKSRADASCSTTASDPKQTRARSEITKPGTETIKGLKRFGSMLAKPLRDLQLAEKLNAINIEREEASAEEYRRRLEEQDRLARETREQEDMERVRTDALSACQRVSRRYDVLIKFIRGCPQGTYQEFIEFVLMGGGMASNDGDIDNDLISEDFHAENSEFRKLWNDNLMTGLPQSASTVEGRHFVPANASVSNAQTEGSSYVRNRTLSEDRIKNQIDQVEETITKGFGSAVNALSSVGSLALQPLREFQLAERLNAMNLDTEDEETQKEIDLYNRRQEEKRDLEEMMKIKQEAEESCLNATRDHLMQFIVENPQGKYNEWIEQLHPENAHTGTLLEGFEKVSRLWSWYLLQLDSSHILFKTIDHRFFVEQSDHRRMWNENLRTNLDASAEGRAYVQARARQMNDDGQYVDAADLLSSAVQANEPQVGVASEERRQDADLIAFD